MASEVVFQPVSEAALVNPPLAHVINTDDEVSFIPMIDVSDSGQWVGNKTRRQREVSVGYTPFEEGDVLFAKITPCMENGKGCQAIGLMNGIGYGSTEFHVLRARPGTDNRFLYHWTMTEAMRKKAEAFMIGSAGQQRVQTSFFDFFRIPKLDEDEQQFASRILDDADETIAKTEALISKLKAIKQGLLHDLLTRGLEENGELRDPERHPEKFKNSPVGKIPKEWDVFHVGAIGTILSGATPSRSVPSYWGGHIPWITPTDMTALRGDCISQGQDWLTPKGLSSRAASLLPVGAIVVTTRASLGLAAITMRELATNQGFKNIVPNKDWNNRFLCYKIRTLTSEMIRRASGTTFLEISGTQFSQIQFASPLPDSGEQALIANTISSYNHRIIFEEEYLSKLKAIKKGLMQDLLTGRVRVKPCKAIAENKR